MKQGILIVFSLILFAFLQMSFFVHVFPRGFIPNGIVGVVLMVTFFEKGGSYASLIAALSGGFLLDVFSSGIIGFWTFALTVFSLLIKKILEEYVRLPLPKKF